MKCQQCGNDAILAKDQTLRPESGPDATVTLQLKGATRQVCDSCAVRLLHIGWIKPAPSKRIPRPNVVKIPHQVRTIPSPLRCTGCRWRTPIKFGGEGIRCFQKDGTCPEWAIKWALFYTKNGYGKRIKSFASDEALLEALRL